MQWNKLLLGVLLAACATPTQSAPTLLGDWKIIKFAPAPWLASEGQDAAPYLASGEQRMGLGISFTSGDIIAADSVLGCTDATYDATLIPPEGLFQGGLPAPDQARLAQELGLPAGEVPGIDVACSTGLFSYHFADEDTALFALDNLIYTIERLK